MCKITDQAFAGDRVRTAAEVIVSLSDLPAVAADDFKFMWLS